MLMHWMGFCLAAAVLLLQQLVLLPAPPVLLQQPLLAPPSLQAAHPRAAATWQLQLFRGRGPVGRQAGEGVADGQAGTWAGEQACLHCRSQATGRFMHGAGVHCCCGLGRPVNIWSVKGQAKGLGSSNSGIQVRGSCASGWRQWQYKLSAGSRTCGQAGEHAQMAGAAAASRVQHPKAIHKQQLAGG